MPKERYARCFAPGANVRSSDFVLLRVEDARQMVADGLARLVNHYKDIQMFARALLRMRQSFIFSLSFMHGVATGDPYCMAVWKWFSAHCTPRWKLPVSIAPTSLANDYEMPMDVTSDEMLRELNFDGNAA